MTSFANAKNENKMKSKKAKKQKSKTMIKIKNHWVFHEHISTKNSHHVGRAHIYIYTQIEADTHTGTNAP